VCGAIQEMRGGEGARRERPTVSADTKYCWTAGADRPHASRCLKTALVGGYCKTGCFGEGAG
jgi:hypothetical protein